MLSPECVSFKGSYLRRQSVTYIRGVSSTRLRGLDSYRACGALPFHPDPGKKDGFWQVCRCVCRVSSLLILLLLLLCTDQTHIILIYYIFRAQAQHRWQLLKTLSHIKSHIIGAFLGQPFQWRSVHNFQSLSIPEFCSVGIFLSLLL